MRAILVSIVLAGLAASCSPAPAPKTDADTSAAGGTMLAAVDAQAGDIAITSAYVAETPGGATNAAGYMHIANNGAAADRLISASSARAERVETHEMVMDGAMASMRPIASLEIAPGTAVVLAPEGLHLMFVGIDAPFARGETVPVELTFERAGVVTMVVPVHPPATADASDLAAH